MADAEDKIRVLGAVFTIGSAGFAAVKNTYFSGGILSWTGGGDVQPLNLDLADTNFEPISGEPEPVFKETQGFSGGNFSNTTKKVIEELLKEGATSEFPPDLSVGLADASLSNANFNMSNPNISSILNTTVPLNLNITETPLTNITPPSNINFTETSQRWLESVASYDYSSALTNPYNYLSAMTTYFTLSNIKAAYDNTGISGAVKQSVKEVTKRAVSVYAAEAISEGVATYFNPEDPVQKEATKQNVKDVIAVTVGVVMPLVSFGMSRYRANQEIKNEAERIKHQMEVDRQEELAIKYATSLFRADGGADLTIVEVPVGLYSTVANTMLQEEQRQRIFSHDFANTISKLPGIDFATVKKHIFDGMDFERAMLILISEKERRKKVVIPEKVIKQAAVVTPPPTTYTPSNTAVSDKPTVSSGSDILQEAAIREYLNRHRK